MAAAAAQPPAKIMTLTDTLVEWLGRRHFEARRVELPEYARVLNDTMGPDCEYDILGELAARRDTHTFELWVIYFGPDPLAAPVAVGFVVIRQGFDRQIRWSPTHQAPFPGFVPNVRGFQQHHDQITDILVLCARPRQISHQIPAVGQLLVLLALTRMLPFGAFVQLQIRMRSAGTHLEFSQQSIERAMGIFTRFNFSRVEVQDTQGNVVGGIHMFRDRRFHMQELCSHLDYIKTQHPGQYGSGSGAPLMEVQLDQQQSAFEFEYPQSPAPYPDLPFEPFPGMMLNGTSAAHDSFFGIDVSDPKPSGFGLLDDLPVGLGNSVDGMQVHSDVAIAAVASGNDNLFGGPMVIPGPARSQPDDSGDETESEYEGSPPRAAAAAAARKKPRKERKQRSPNPQHSFVCSVCGETFAKKANLQRHIEPRKGVRRAGHENAVMPATAVGLGGRKPLDEKHKPTRCPVCHIEGRFDHIKRHLIKEHPNSPEAKKLVIMSIRKRMPKNE